MQKFTLIAGIEGFEVIHAFADSDAAMDAIRNGIDEWLKSKEGIEHTTPSDDDPYPIFTWSHYLFDRVGDFGIEGIQSIDAIIDVQVADLDYDFVKETIPW